MELGLGLSLSNPQAGGTFTPASESGLNLWLTPAGLSGADLDPITTWADESGAGNDFTQATVNNKPRVRTSAANGYNVMETKSATGNGRLNLSTANFAIAQVFCVFRANGATFDDYGAFLGSATRPFIFEIGTTGFYSAPLPVAVWKNGASLSSPFNLTTINSYMCVAISTADPATARAYQVGASEETYFAHLFIAEMIGYDHVLDAGRRAQVENYLMDKYAIS
jgi:hypothetical protein